MKLTVLQSSSKGNCYLLHDDQECLILECGVRLKEVKKAVDFDLSIIRGAVISHQHSDHAKYMDEFLNAGIHVYGNEETMSKARYNFFGHVMLLFKKYQIGNFTVIPIPAHHDVPCFSFAITNNKMGGVVFAIDTCEVTTHIHNFNYLFCECNYAEDILQTNVEKGKVTAQQMARLRNSHFELNNMKEFARTCAKNSKDLREIVLLHLSDNNSDENRFISEVEQATGIPTIAAKQGTEINMIYNL